MCDAKNVNGVRDRKIIDLRMNRSAGRSLVKSGRRAREVQTPERFRLTTNGSSLWALDAN
jgi:hypothetical protein